MTSQMRSRPPDSITSFRDLFELLQDYEGSNCFEDVLLPALPRAMELLEPLRCFRNRRSVKTVSGEEEWAFFALSVVNDYLLLPLRVSRREYLHFFEALGFEPFEGERSARSGTRSSGWATGQTRGGESSWDGCPGRG